MNDGMPIINFLRDHGGRALRGRFELRPINHGVGFGPHRRRGGSSGSRRCVMDGNFADFGVSGGGDAVNFDAFVDHGFINDGIVIDNGGVIINPGDLGRSQPVVIKIVMIEIVHGDERKVLGVQSEIEADRNMDAVEAPPHAGNELRVRREGCPATMIAFTTPNNPGGTPNAVGRPDPATTRVQLPTPIMERSPAP